jgi:hypothetical protein
MKNQQRGGFFVEESWRRFSDDKCCHQGPIL